VVVFRRVLFIVVENIPNSLMEHSHLYKLMDHLHELIILDGIYHTDVWAEQVKKDIVLGVSASQVVERVIVCCVYGVEIDVVDCVGLVDFDLPVGSVGSLEDNFQFSRVH